MWTHYTVQSGLMIDRYFEDGATGVMIPLQNTADDVAALVEKVKFPPEGNRGIDAAGVDAAYGDNSWGKGENSLASYVLYEPPLLFSSSGNQGPNGSRFPLRKFKVLFKREAVCPSLSAVKNAHDYMPAWAVGVQTVKHSSPSRSRRGQRSPTSKRWPRSRESTSSSSDLVIWAGGCPRKGAVPRFLDFFPPALCFTTMRCLP
jgi:hypothetical protein